jgi:GH15 family glucan-1,4-alpha-glucosidase
MTRIEDYAFIGDTHSAGLVSKDGSIDWLCLPHFDSASCFGAILDPHAGSWRIRPAADDISVDRSYLGDTLILRTTFTTDTGVVHLIDCLTLEKDSDPKRPRDIHPHEVLVRIVECVKGEVEMGCDFQPRFDYGGILPWFREHGGAVEAVGGRDALDLVASVPLTIDRSGASTKFRLKAGEGASFLASYHQSHLEVEPRAASECHELMEETRLFWEAWAKRCGYQGPHRKRVLRSLLTLKALTFAPTGGVVAAPTTSLPEQIGGPRNWDYRYCWLRDATFTLDVLLEQGYTEEAEEWRDWLLRSVAGDPQDMQIMYGVRGERRLPEAELPLAGYEGSTPVRIGNAAHSQFQLDVYGEVMDSFHSARRAGIDTPTQAWELEKIIVDFVCERWREPDEGIWEVRSGPQHFVHSKVMAWVAVDRGIRAIEKFGEEGPVERWRSVRADIRTDILSRGTDPARGCFVRSYGERHLDASLLMLPFVGFMEATEPLMRATIEAVMEDLMVDGFVLRYRTDAVADGLLPGEGTFLMCSFWLVDCLVLLGRHDEAEKMFGRLVGVANDLGLLAEQYEPTAARMLGNFPQAFSHVALVTSALTLDTAGRTAPLQRGQ